MLVLLLWTDLGRRGERAMLLLPPSTAACVASSAAQRGRRGAVRATVAWYRHGWMLDLKPATTYSFSARVARSLVRRPDDDVVV